VPRKPGYIRDEILMFLGVFVGGIGTLALLGGRSRALAPALVLLSAGVVLFLVGLKFRRIENRLRRTLDVLRSVDRSSLAEIARASGYSLEDTRSSVVFLIGHGYVSLRFDPRTDALYSPLDRSRPGGAGSWLELPGECPTCLAPTPTMVEGMVSYRCEYCGAPVPGKLAKVETPGFDPNVAARPSENIHQVFTGSWGVLVLLFLVFWPAAIVYLTRGLKGSGTENLFRR
jgi:hypothetical protein